MSTTNGFQLLSLPKHMKENIMPPNNPQQTHQARLPFKFLSLSSAPSAEKSPKLILMPKMIPPKQNIPLLTLPKKTQNVPKRSEKVFKITGSPEKCSLPLLKRPKIPEQPILVKIPTVVERAEKKPVLISIPIRQHHEGQKVPKKVPVLRPYPETGVIQPENIKGFRSQSVVQVKPKQFEYLKTNLNEESQAEIFGAHGKHKEAKFGQEAMQESSDHMAKRKRHRKRADSKQLIMQMKENVSGIKSNDNASAVHQKVSKKTQTSADPQRKMKDRKRKLNLLSLLEKAALLEGSDISTDEESILNLMSTSSHLVKEEPYSRAKLDDKAKIGVKRPTVEELLLQNFDEPAKDVPRRSAAIAEPSQRIKGYTRTPNIVTQEGKNIIYKTESSTQTFADIQFPKLQIHDKPLAAAGPSWSELIQPPSTKKIGSAENSERSLREIGVQVSEFHPSIDKVEQMSQTDFTQEKDVAALLLQNLQEGRKVRKETSTETVLHSDVSNHVGKYPWQYITDTDFSDVLTSRRELQPENASKSQNIKRKEGISVDSDSVARNAKVKETEEHASIQSNRANFPPELFLRMRVQGDCVTAKTIDGEGVSQPLQVIDISMPSSPLASIENGPDHIIIDDIAVERLKESTEIDGEKIKTEWELMNDSIEDGFQEHKIHNMGEEIIQSKGHYSDELKSINEGLMTSNKSDSKVRESQVAAQAERFKNIMESEPKGRLRSNLRNMSVQLDALDELSAQLEKEMKNSSMLMNFVETVNQGFFEELEVFKRVPNRYKKDIKTSSRYEKSHLARSSLPVAVEEEPVEVQKSETIELKPQDVDFVEKAASVQEEDIAITDNEEEDDKHEEFNSIQSDSLDEVLQRDSKEDRSHRSTESSGHLGLVENISDDERISTTTAIKSDQNGGLERELNEADCIRERIAKKFPTMSKKRVEEDKAKAELSLKQKLENKRKALQAWMKRRRAEQNRKYLKEVEEKRQKENRPFIGAKNPATVIGEQLWKSETPKPSRKQHVSEDTYQERIDGAQKLLDDLFAVRSDAISIEKSAQPVLSPAVKSKPRSYRGQQTFAKLKRKAANVYGKDINKPRRAGIRNRARNKGTGGSDMGQTLVNDISGSLKNNADLSGFLKDVPNIVDGNEFELLDNDLRLDLGLLNSHYEPYYSSTARADSNRYKLDLAQLSGRRTPDLNSSRTRSHRSYDGRDFITKKSMDNYRKKTARLVEESMKEYASIEMEDSLQGRGGGSSLGSKGFNSTDFLTDQERFLVDRIMNERKSNDENVVQEAKRKRAKSPHRRIDESKDVNDILSQYGLLNENLDGYGSEETSKLLAEADAFLDVGSEAGNSNSEETIDWNEIDNILNQ